MPPRYEECPGGDDDELGLKDGGDKISAGFAGADLDDERLAIGEGGFDGLGHFELAGAVLVCDATAKAHRGMAK